MKRVVYILGFMLCALAINAQELSSDTWQLKAKRKGAVEVQAKTEVGVTGQWPTKIVVTGATECFCYFSYGADRGVVNNDEQAIQLIYADRIVEYRWTLLNAKKKEIELEYRLLSRGSLSDAEGQKAIYQLQ